MGNWYVAVNPFEIMGTSVLGVTTFNGKKKILGFGIMDQMLKNTHYMSIYSSLSHLQRYQIT